MSDRLTDAELDRLEGLARNPLGLPTARLHDALLRALPALLAEVREHRAREAAHRAALDALVDGDGR